jgi:hypothetical protein
MSLRQTSGIRCLSISPQRELGKNTVIFSTQMSRSFNKSLDGNTDVKVAGVGGKPDAAAVFTDSLL